MIFAAEDEECVRMTLGGGMELRIGGIPLDECIFSPADTPESIAANRARIKRDSAYEKRIWDKTPLSDEEVMEILEGTDCPTVEIKLLERIKKEDRDILCQVILNCVGQRYRIDAEKIKNIRSLTEAADLITPLCSRVLTFVEYDVAQLHDWRQILEKLYEQIYCFNDALRPYIFSDLFDIAQRADFKRYTIDPLPDQLIIKIVEFILNKESGISKKNILKAVGERLPQQLLERMH